MYTNVHQCTPIIMCVSCLRTQALTLAAVDDALLGRSQDGGMWLWDLSVCLGWSQPMQGCRASWLVPWTEEGYDDWQRQGRPQLLGYVALDTGINTALPSVRMVDGAEGAVLAMVEDDGEERSCFVAWQ